MLNIGVSIETRNSREAKQLIGKLDIVSCNKILKYKEARDVATSIFKKKVTTLQNILYKELNN